MPPMHLSGLFVYPVKSLRGFSVSTSAVDALGLDGAAVGEARRSRFLGP